MRVFTLKCGALGPSTVTAAAGRTGASHQLMTFVLKAFQVTSFKHI